MMEFLEGNSYSLLAFRYFPQEALRQAIQRCSYKSIFWKYAAELKENTRAEVWFQ